MSVLGQLILTKYLITYYFIFIITYRLMKSVSCQQRCRLWPHGVAVSRQQL